MTKSELIAFEAEVARRFEAKEILGPVHLCSEFQAEVLPEIFAHVKRGDWCFATYRSHFHALLHGVPAQDVMARVLEGKSMNLSFPEHRFYSSAIVGGHLSIAVGVALAIKRKRTGEHVWCFLGDMAAASGAFHEANQYAQGHKLPINFVVEDNSLSCDSPTVECWGPHYAWRGGFSYSYKREWPHVGVGKHIAF